MRRVRLEVFWESRWAALAENLRVLLLERARRPRGHAAVWFGDARLSSWLPGRALLLSVLLHVLVIVTPLPGFLTAPPRPLGPDTLIIAYDLKWASNTLLLPRIAPTQPSEPEKKKEPPGPAAEADSPQTIVSNPPQPNHPTQTLLAEFWAKTLRAPALRLPNIVIPPAPELKPAPSLLASLAFSPLLTPARPGDILLAETQLENLRVRLPVRSRRRAAAPPPAIGGPSVPREVPGLPGGLVALSLNPVAPTPTLEIPETRLRARFAVGPKGARSQLGEEAAGQLALGIPGIAVSGASDESLLGPAIVGPAPPPSTPEPSPPTAAPNPALPPEPQQSPEERAQKLLDALTPTWQRSASQRRVYTTYINMPNVTSESSSWLLHFAELEADNPNDYAGGGDEIDVGSGLAAPLVVTKVDPRYPADARRERVEGTVVLYAVIRADGGVEDVAVVGGVDPRLDQSAAEAFARWRLLPATKDGQPVALEVVIEIPFRLTRLR
ncbi:MAG: energy transducer TonB [Terriglobia bacterium]